MAKRKKTILSDDAVQVNSRTYGTHWRAKRGSKSPTNLNSSLQKSTEDLAAANKAARLIKSCLDPFRYNFMGGLIWQKLVKEFKQQAKTASAFHTSSFLRMDVWDLYQLNRFRTYFNFDCDVIDLSELRIQIKPNQHPDFKRKFTDSYRLSMLAIFPDFEHLQVQDEGCIADPIFMKGAVQTIAFNFAVPEGAKHYLLVLKVEGTENGKISGNHTIKGMQILCGGSIG
ncbi:hypothetical protein [Pedobacter alpinus]|uniref:Uncharacterized protein n=1 Tax=Pedobacter alpinus TaxID=1590643 RepID=A0ABW5TTB0_9SPHI